MLTIRIPGPRGRRVTAALGLAAILSSCTPAGPRALLDGERLLKEGKPNEAVRRLRTAVEFLPANAQAWNHLGLACQGARLPIEAARAYQEALRLDRNLAVVHYNLGCLRIEQGDARQAAESLNRYVALQPRSAEGWRRLGQAQLRIPQAEAAARSFNAALQLAPNDPEALNGLGVAYQQTRRFRDAWMCFSGAIRAAPRFAPAWLNLGVVAQQAGARPQAIQAYRQYALLNPEAARALGVEATVRNLETAPPTPLPLAPQISHATNPLPSEPVPSPAPRVIRPEEQPQSTQSTTPTFVPPETRRPSTLASAAPTRSSPAETSAVPQAPVIVQTPSPSPPIKTSNAIPEPRVSTNAVRTPPPLEVVELNSGPKPAVRTLDDSAPARVAESSSQTNPLVRPVSSQRAAAGSDASRGFWDRANPANWFAGERTNRRGSPGTQVSSLSATNASAQGAPGIARPDSAAFEASRNPISKPPEDLRQAPPVSPPQIRRYAYRNPRRPDPGDREAAQPILAEAMQAHRLGRTQTAVSLYEQALRLDPALEFGYHNLAVAALQQGDLPKALAASEVALALKPDSTSGRLNFALALDRSGFPLDAANEAEKIANVHPDHVAAHLLLGNLYSQHLQMEDRARDHYMKVIELDPGNNQSIAIRHWLADQR